MVSVMNCKMFENPIESILLAAAGILLGGLSQGYYWSRNLKKTEKNIKLNEKNMKKMDKQIKNLNTNLNEQKTEIENMNLELSEKKEETIRLQSKLEEQKEFTAKLKIYTASILEQNKEHDKTIERLNQEVSAYMKQSPDLILRIEALAATNQQLEKTIQNLEGWNLELRSRMQRMQDDLSVIDGIGPKVADVLRLAKVNTFSKLASITPDEISKILGEKDTRLLRLTDPTSWPRQAKLASEEDWEGLSALKYSFKESKSIKKRKGSKQKEKNLSQP